MKSTFRSLTGVLAFCLASTATAEDALPIMISDDLGRISLSSVFGTWEFLIPSFSAASDSSWGGLNDEDQNVRLLGQHPEGGDLFLSIVYDYGPRPEIWLHLVSPEDAVSYGGTSEWMQIEVTRYEKFPHDSGNVDVVIEGRFEGDLQDEFGRRADVDGWFEAQVPRVAFSIALPDPELAPAQD